MKQIGNHSGDNIASKNTDEKPKEKQQTTLVKEILSELRELRTTDPARHNMHLHHLASVLTV